MTTLLELRYRDLTFMIIYRSLSCTVSHVVSASMCVEDRSERYPEISAIKILSQHQFLRKVNLILS